jgi:hypothetical protein
VTVSEPGCDKRRKSQYKEPKGKQSTFEDIEIGPYPFPRIAENKSAKADLKYQCEEQHIMPAAISAPALLIPIQRIRRKTITKIMAEPVKTPICLALMSPTTGASNSVRRVPWMISATISRSRTIKALNQHIFRIPNE